MSTVHETIDDTFWYDVKENMKLFAASNECVLCLEGDAFGQISRVNHLINGFEKVITSMPDKYSTSIRNALQYMHQFQRDFNDDLYPLIYVAEFCNPSLRLTLNENQKNGVINYITQRAKALGYSIPVHTTEQRRGGIIEYTDTPGADDVFRDLLDNRRFP